MAQKRRRLAKGSMAVRLNRLLNFFVPDFVSILWEVCRKGGAREVLRGCVRRKEGFYIIWKGICWWCMEAALRRS